MNRTFSRAGSYPLHSSDWPDPTYPPYYAAPPTGYYFGAALATGLAFTAGAAGSARFVDRHI